MGELQTVCKSLIYYAKLSKAFYREVQHQQSVLNIRDSNWDLFDLRVAEDLSMILVITEIWNRKGVYWPVRGFSMGKSLALFSFTCRQQLKITTLKHLYQESRSLKKITWYFYLNIFQHFNIWVSWSEKFITVKQKLKSPEAVHRLKVSVKVLHRYESQYNRGVRETGASKLTYNYG